MTSRVSMTMRFSTAVFTVLSLVLFAQRTEACGVNWDVPVDRFNGINENGFVSYWDKIGEIDIGEDTKLPLVIGFQSDREKSSPYLGYGWVMPLLESYMVQKNENTFEIMKPGGYTSGFGRDSKNPSLISGVKGWKGKIERETIKVWADCGWSLTYTKGKLTNIGTPKSKNIQINRDSSGLVTDVTLDSIVLLKVRRSSSGIVTGFELADGKEIVLKQAERPRTQVIQGQNLIAGKDMSLSGYVQSNGDKSEIEYGLDDKLRPMISIAKPGEKSRLIVWDPGSRYSLSDGDWLYEVKALGESGGDAFISRKNSAGQIELWHNEPARGRTTFVKSGTTTVSNFFTSGVLSGKLRSMTSTGPDGKANETYRASYNEKGQLLREFDHGKLSRELGYNSEGELVYAFTNSGGFPVAVRYKDINTEATAPKRPETNESLPPDSEAFEVTVKKGLIQKISDSSGNSVELSKFWEGL